MTNHRNKLNIHCQTGANVYNGNSNVQAVRVQIRMAFYFVDITDHFPITMPMTIWSEVVPHSIINCVDCIMKGLEKVTT